MKINFKWKNNILYVGDMSFGYIDKADNYYSKDELFITTWMNCEDLCEEFSTFEAAQKYIENKTVEFVNKLLKGIEL